MAAGNKALNIYFDHFELLDDDENSDLFHISTALELEAIPLVYR